MRDARCGRSVSPSAGDRRPTRRAWWRTFRGRRIRAHQAPTADPQSIPSAVTQSPVSLIAWSPACVRSSSAHAG